MNNLKFKALCFTAYKEGSYNQAIYALYEYERVRGSFDTGVYYKNDPTATRLYRVIKSICPKDDFDFLYNIIKATEETTYEHFEEKRRAKEEQNR